MKSTRPVGAFVKNSVAHSVRFIEIWTLKVRSGSPAKWNWKAWSGKRAKFVSTGRDGDPPVCARAGRDHTIGRIMAAIHRSDARCFTKREDNPSARSAKWDHYPMNNSVASVFGHQHHASYACKRIL